MGQGVTTRFWLIRHAPVINPDRLVYGASDMPANIEGAADALDEAAIPLPEGAVWVTTHLSRTKDTAQALADRRGFTINPIEVPELAEQNMGDWEMQSWDTLQGDDVIEFWTDFARLQPPSGESFSQQIERCGKATDKLIADHSGRDIVCVLHGGSIRGVLAGALALRPDSALAFHIDTLSITRMDFIDEVARPGWRVTSVNGRGRALG
jgi:alpha-ribazole phosphatase